MNVAFAFMLLRQQKSDQIANQNEASWFFEAGLLFGTGEKSFEKYESGEIEPSGPTKRLLKLAMERPELFRKPSRDQVSAPAESDPKLVHKTLRAAAIDEIYGQLFAAT